MKLIVFKHVIKNRVNYPICVLCGVKEFREMQKKSKKIYIYLTNTQYNLHNVLN